MKTCWNSVINIFAIMLSIMTLNTVIFCYFSYYICIHSLYRWRCLHSMWCKVYVMNDWVSVHQSVPFFSSRLLIHICHQCQSAAAALPQPGHRQQSWCQISINICRRSELRLRVASCWEPRYEALHRLVLVVITISATCVCSWCTFLVLEWQLRSSSWPLKTWTASERFW